LIRPDLFGGRNRGDHTVDILRHLEMLEQKHKDKKVTTKIDTMPTSRINQHVTKERNLYQGGPYAYLLGRILCVVNASPQHISTIRQFF
jgi:hypothetical protein